MKKLFSLLLVCCMLCVCFASCATVEDGISNNSDNALSVNVPTGLTYIGMRINPEIELVVDEDGVVVGVNAVNEDGETVLAELTLTGMDVAEAGEAFTSVATELGFIDVDAEEATVYILAEGEAEEAVEAIEEKITEKINGFFEKKGIFGKVAPEELDEHDELAKELDISPKDARLVKRILELYPEMTAEEIIALSFEERLALIKDDAHKNGMTVELRKEFKGEIDTLKEEFKEMFELAKQMRDIEKQLRNEELSEEKITALREKLDAIKAKFDALKSKYDVAVENVKTEKKGKVEETKKQIKEKAQERREMYEEKIEKHIADFEEKKDEIVDKIQEWRDKGVRR